MKLALALSTCLAIVPLAFATTTGGLGSPTEPATVTVDEVVSGRFSQDIFYADECDDLCAAISAAENNKELKQMLADAANADLALKETALTNATTAVTNAEAAVAAAQDLLDLATLGGIQDEIDRAGRLVNEKRGELADAKDAKELAQSARDIANTEAVRANARLEAACDQLEDAETDAAAAGCDCG